MEKIKKRLLQLLGGTKVKHLIGAEYMVETSDRLPKANKLVLIYLPERFTLLVAKYDKAENMFLGKNGIYYEILEVSHWRSLN